MQVLKLAKRLLQVAEINPTAEVVLYNSDREVYVKFTGFNTDDNNDIVLDIVGGDIDH